MTPGSHPSSPAAQPHAEKAIVAAFSTQRQIVFSPGARKIELDAVAKTRIEVDATTEAHAIVIEAYAR